MSEDVYTPPRPTWPPLLEERIRKERERLALRPWQFSPTETQGQPCPYPKSNVCHDHWNEMAELYRRMQRERFEQGWRQTLEERRSRRRKKASSTKGK